ncbi:MAG: hypothetical protein WAV47_05480 [Blastocatellia bacterium]
MPNPNLLILLIATSFITTQSQSIDITKNTKWKDSPDLRFVEGTVQFRPERDLGDGARKCADISIEMTFKNQSEKSIKRIDFEIVLYGKKSEGRNYPNSKISRRQRFYHDNLLLPGATGSLVHEEGDCELFSPVRQTVRVVRIIYETGHRGY